MERPSNMKSAAVRGFLHFMLRITYMVLVSQQTRVLMGLKVVMMIGAG